MDKVLGKYLEQPGNDFPLDCETFDYIQNNNLITEILGNLAGDKCFIYGCEKNGRTYNSGYAFLRTKEHPEGEILPLDKGTSSGRLYINSEEVSVTVNDKTYSAYTKRSLSHAQTTYDKVGYDLNEFTYASYNQPLYGEIKIWSGKLDKIPLGYHICDGSELSQTEYPNLYKVIGDVYNKQHKGSRSTYNPKDPNDYYTTRDGYFRIPDLTARFIVGCDSSGKMPSDDINVNGFSYGTQGGLSTCRLTGAQSALPVHNHEAWGNIGRNGDHFHGTIGESYDTGPYGLYSTTKNNKGLKDVSMDQDNYTYKTSTNGSHTHSISVGTHDIGKEIADESHENKPPFMVLCYIIRCC